MRQCRSRPRPRGAATNTKRGHAALRPCATCRRAWAEVATRGARSPAAQRGMKPRGALQPATRRGARAQRRG
eukprot:4924300-Alexandrium_andersonii.AAC.1